MLTAPSSGACLPLAVEDRDERGRLAAIMAAISSTVSSSLATGRAGRSLGTSSWTVCSESYAQIESANSSSSTRASVGSSWT